MKKLMIILAFVFTGFFFSAKGQSLVFYKNAKEVRNLLNSKPKNLNEKDAWAIITKQKDYQTIGTIDISFNNLYLTANYSFYKKKYFIKNNEWYSKSEQFAKSGLTYSPLAIILMLSFFIFLFFKVSKMSEKNDFLVPL